MKTVVTYSGGLDSTVLLAKLKAEGRQIKAVSILYGQRHKIEIQAAENICALLGIEHQVVDLSNLRPLLAGSSQTDSSVPVPHGHYEEASMKQTVVPMRNAWLLCAAAAWAISSKCDTVAYAAHAGDHAIYPDCRPVFASAFGVMLSLADWHQVRLEAPFAHSTKAEIVKLGWSLGRQAQMAMQMSYSCYEGDVVHCGQCGTCVERREAFTLAGVPDPTLYKV